MHTFIGGGINKENHRPVPLTNIISRTLATDDHDRCYDTFENGESGII